MCKIGYEFNTVDINCDTSEFWSHQHFSSACHIRPVARICLRGVLPPPLLTNAGGPGVSPPEFFEIVHAHRWVLMHFGTKNITCYRSCHHTFCHFQGGQMSISRSFCFSEMIKNRIWKSNFNDGKFRYCKNYLQMKLSELHDWHMFLTAGQLGITLMQGCCWWVPIVQPMSDMTEWLNMNVYCGKGLREELLHNPNCSVDLSRRRLIAYSVNEVQPPATLQIEHNLHSRLSRSLGISPRKFLKVHVFKMSFSAFWTPNLTLHQRVGAWNTHEKKFWPCLGGV